jgi:hypothetical protein
MRQFSFRAGRVLALGFLLGLAPSLALAQATGSISGTAKDESGAVLPGVTIEATSATTNNVRTATTGPNGFYTIPLVQPGTYSVKASLAGFSAYSRSGIKVNVSESALVNVSLKVGGQSETIDVTGEAPLIETANATLGIVVEEKKIVDLPLNGRNFTQLGTATPRQVPTASEPPPPASTSTASGTSRTTSCSTAPPTTTRSTPASSFVLPRTPFRSSRSSPTPTARNTVAIRVRW